MDDNNTPISIIPKDTTSTFSSRVNDHKQCKDSKPDTRSLPSSDTNPPNAAGQQLSLKAQHNNIPSRAPTNPSVGDDLDSQTVVDLGPSNSTIRSVEGDVPNNNHSLHQIKLNNTNKESGKRSDILHSSAPSTEGDCRVTSSAEQDSQSTRSESNTVTILNHATREVVLALTNGLVPPPQAQYPKVSPPLPRNLMSNGAADSLSVPPGGRLVHLSPNVQGNGRTRTDKGSTSYPETSITAEPHNARPNCLSVPASGQATNEPVIEYHAGFAPPTFPTSPGLYISPLNPFIYVKESAWFEIESVFVIKFGEWHWVPEGGLKKDTPIEVVLRVMACQNIPLPTRGQSPLSCKYLGCPAFSKWNWKSQAQEKTALISIFGDQMRAFVSACYQVKSALQEQAQIFLSGGSPTPIRFDLPSELVLGEPLSKYPLITIVPHGSYLVQEFTKEVAKKAEEEVEVVKEWLTTWKGAAFIETKERAYNCIGWTQRSKYPHLENNLSISFARTFAKWQISPDKSAGDSWTTPSVPSLFLNFDSRDCPASGQAVKSSRILEACLHHDAHNLFGIFVPLPSTFAVPAPPVRQEQPKEKKTGKRKATAQPKADGRSKKSRQTEA